jgi:hypothetical protein
MALPWLPDVFFRHACPNCGHVRSETGVWFRFVSSYKCAACSTRVRITYEEKVRILSRDLEGNADPEPRPSPDLPADVSTQQPSGARSKH